MTVAPPTSEPTTKDSTALDALQQLLTRAKAGDRSTLPELRRLLDEDKSLWLHYGDLALQAEAGLVRVAAGSNLLLAEAIMRRQADRKTELAAGSNDPVIRALTDRASILGLQVGYFDGLIAQCEGQDLGKLRPLREHLDGANRRYLAALKALATVQKLLKPTLSPLTVATRLDGRRSVRRESAVAAGVGVEN